MKVIDKNSLKLIEVYDIKISKEGNPKFLIYSENLNIWEYVNSKNFRPL